MKRNSLIQRLNNNWAPPIYDQLPSWILPQRSLKFKAYGVGLFKTGTASLYALFIENYRTYHEAEARFLIQKILAFEEGKITREQLIQSVKKRDRRLGLEMDSSSINGHIIDILATEFNTAKFILTIRDCYSWLDSIFNHYIFISKRYQKWSKWQYWRGQHFIHWESFIYQAHLKHAKPEQILADHGLYTLDGYLSYWAKHTNQVLTAVPSERLLIIKTLDFNQSISQIEDFLEITSGSLPRNTKINVRKAKDKYNLLSQIDRSFVEEKINLYCRELMDKFFPEVTWP